MSSFTERVPGLNRLLRHPAMNNQEGAVGLKAMDTTRADIVRAIDESFVWLRDWTADERGQLEKGEITPRHLTRIGRERIVDYNTLACLFGPLTPVEAEAQGHFPTLVQVNMGDGTFLMEHFPVDGVMRALLGRGRNTKDDFDRGRMSLPEYEDRIAKLASDYTLIESYSKPPVLARFRQTEQRKAVEAWIVSQDPLRANTGPWAANENWLTACRTLETRRELIFSAQSPK